MNDRMKPCPQPQAHPARCGCEQSGVEQVSSAWLAQLREEYRLFGSECQRLRTENGRLEAERAEQWRLRRDAEASRDTNAAVAAELQTENDRLRALLAQKLVDSTMLTGLVPDASGINIGMQGGACGLLADAFGEQLFESGAENYIEAFFSSRKYHDLGQIIVTVRRETGKTPHALRQEAEGAAKRMVSLLAEIRNGMSANWTPKSGKALLCRTTLMARIDAELSGGAV